MEKELCVMLWVSGLGSAPPFPNYPNASPHSAKEGCSWEKADVQCRDSLTREREAHKHPLVWGAGLALCAGAAGPLPLRAAPSALLLTLRILVEFNKPMNTQV